MPSKNCFPACNASSAPALASGSPVARRVKTKSPSLAIRETDDGTILMHDFGGDSVEAILGAVGLSFADLFPDKPGAIGKPIRRPFSASDVLSLVAFESSVAVIVVRDLLRRNSATEQDLDRLLVAAQRLGHAAEVCNGPR